MRADEVYAILKGKLVKLTEDIKSMGDWKPIQHKGTVQTADDLPADAKEGYMYNIATDSIYGAAGMNVVKTADGWDPMGPIVNMEPYLTKEEAKKVISRPETIPQKKRLKKGISQKAITLQIFHRQQEMFLAVSKLIQKQKKRWFRQRSILTPERCTSQNFLAQKTCQKKIQHSRFLQNYRK